MSRSEITVEQYLSEGIRQLNGCLIHAKRRIARVVFFRLYPKVDRKLHVCHSCDTPACIEPTHLFIGTRSDNVQDSIHKGRYSRHEDLMHDGVVKAWNDPTHRLNDRQMQSEKARRAWDTRRKRYGPSGKE